MKRIFSAFIFAAAMAFMPVDSSAANNGVTVTTLSNKNYFIQDDVIGMTLPPDFSQVSDHVWESKLKSLKVTITHKPSTQTHKAFVESSINDRVLTKYSAVILNKDFEIGDNKLGTFLIVFNYKFKFISSIVVLDKKVGHSVDCVSEKDYSDKFVLGCKKILDSVTIK